MYRIHFDHQIGKFILQVNLFLGLYWATVRRGEKDSYAFDTFEEARQHVAKIGLDQLYQDRSENKRHNYMLLTH